MNRQPQTETATQTANATHKHIKNEKAKTVNWQPKKNSATRSIITQSVSSTKRIGRVTNLSVVQIFFRESGNTACGIFAWWVVQGPYIGARSRYHDVARRIKTLAKNAEIAANRSFWKIDQSGGPKAKNVFTTFIICPFSIFDFLCTNVLDLRKKRKCHYSLVFQKFSSKFSGKCSLL